MTEDDVFQQTEDAYLCLVHPALHDKAWRQQIVIVQALAPSAPDKLIAGLIAGAGWRERLLGLCLGMLKQPASFVEAMLQSLRDPRGISIVPTCAALAVLARHEVFSMTPSFADAFDRDAFDGEMGWAVDKAMHAAGLRADDVPGRGPNYGQHFGDHLELYEWLLQA